MKPHRRLSCGFVAVCAASLLSIDASGQAPPLGSGTLAIPGGVRVIDGDTVEVYVSGRRIGIGLIGIRAPMGNTPCGREATAMLESLVAGGAFMDEHPELFLDTRRRRLYYGRRASNGQSIAVQLARAGVVESTGVGREAPQIAAAIRTAQTRGDGCLWR